MNLNILQILPYHYSPAHENFLQTMCPIITYLPVLRTWFSAVLHPNFLCSFSNHHVAFASGSLDYHPPIIIKSVV